METLAQWLTDHPKAYAMPKDWGAYIIYKNGEDSAGLFHLADYAVSSTTYLFCWLVRRRNNTTT